MPAHANVSRNANADGAHICPPQRVHGLCVHMLCSITRVLRLRTLRVPMHVRVHFLALLTLCICLHLGLSAHELVQPGLPGLQQMSGLQVVCVSVCVNPTLLHARMRFTLHPTLRNSNPTPYTLHPTPRVCTRHSGRILRGAQTFTTPRRPRVRIRRGWGATCNRRNNRYSRSMRNNLPPSLRLLL